MEYKNILARSEIKSLMDEQNLSNRQCAIALGITDQSFTNKLYRGSFSLGDYLILLKAFGLRNICINVDDYTY
jgi:predicted XRE-type DNA-binding protein